DRARELASPDGEDPSAATDLVFLGGERRRLVAFASRLVDERASLKIEGEAIPVAGIGHRFRTLHHVEPQVQRIAPEDVAHVVPARLPCERSRRPSSGAWPQASSGQDESCARGKATATPDGPQRAAAASTSRRTAATISSVPGLARLGSDRQRGGFEQAGVAY